ncbi:MAG TPA: TadE/TadG family type IV pilus assembly protein [Acidimicrobiales bacterium]|nr:TadE/TadG family type IV pilus assembly protein [Acidimicrobiales bacterium]
MTRRGEGGQATVEVALLLPLVATMLLGVVQVGLVVRDQVLVTHAAREAARAAAVDPTEDAARQGAEAAARLEADRLAVELSGDTAPGGRLTVTVRYRAPTDVPLVGQLLGDRTVTAEATMRVE